MRLFYLKRELKAADLGENVSLPVSVGLKFAQRVHPEKIHFTSGYELGYILQALTQAGKEKDLNVITFNSQHTLLERQVGLQQIGASDATGSIVSFARFLRSIAPGTIRSFSGLTPAKANVCRLNSLGTQTASI